MNKRTSVHTIPENERTIARKILCKCSSPFTNFIALIALKDFNALIILTDLKILNTRKTVKYGRVANIEIRTITKSKIFHLYLKKSLLNAINFNNNSTTKIHPRIEFDYTAPINVDMKEWREWHKNRDKLPNLQLLDKHNNRLKSDVPLIDWYNDLKTEEARKKFKLETFIPDNVSLELKAFGDFYEARKELLRKKIKDVLSF